jgi:hypothetical protein
MKAFVAESGSPRNAVNRGASIEVGHERRRKEAQCKSYCFAFHRTHEPCHYREDRGFSLKHLIMLIFYVLDVLIQGGAVIPLVSDFRTSGPVRPEFER